MKDPETWAKRLQNVEADIVCVGHSHMQFNLEVDGVVVLNPGSVGQPRDGDPRAAYAIIEDNRIELKRVAYPIEETIARVEAMPWPRRAKEIMAHVLRLGRLPLGTARERSRDTQIIDETGSGLDDRSRSTSDRCSIRARRRAARGSSAGISRARRC